MQNTHKYAKYIESKNKLARLLATENLTVQHEVGITSAYFEPKSRKVGLPVWKDMGNDVYDLLIGHEVGHALYTPPKGWHTNVSKKGKVYQGYLNICEDARIEKKQKIKYPGLKRAFTEGYRWMINNGFFGEDIKGRINGMPLIDRLNIKLKVGTALDIEFSKEEMQYVKRMENLITFKDAVKLADELFETQKSESDPEQSGTSEGGKPGENEEGEETEESGSSPDENAQTEETDGAPSGEETAEGSEEEGRGEGEEGEETEETQSDEGTASGETGSEETEAQAPVSQTDTAYRENADRLVENTNEDEISYLTLPTPKLENIIVSTKQVGEDLKRWTEEILTANRVRTSARLLKTWRNENKGLINYLVKEFEMKKSADDFRRTFTAKTGVIDPLKLHTYKFAEDIFKKSSVMTDGKNHGLIMFIDWSSSMKHDIFNTMQQLLTLIEFCRKVNIPYDVYAFTDGYTTAYGRGFSETMKNIQVNDIVITNLGLLHLFSSKMKIRDHKLRSRDMLGMSKFLEGGRWDSCPKGYRLCSTPLNEAIMCSYEIVKQFQKTNNVQVVNTVFLTDGDSNACKKIGPLPKMKQTNEVVPRIPIDDPFRAELVGNNDIVHDPVTKKDYTQEKINTGSTYSSCWNSDRRNMTKVLLTILRDRCGVNAVGFFLTSQPIIKALEAFTSDDIDQEATLEFFEKHQAVVMKDAGYNELYIIKGGKDLGKTKKQLEDEYLGRFTAGGYERDAETLKEQLVKMTKKKLVSRVILSKFIDQIA